MKPMEQERAILLAIPEWCKGREDAQQDAPFTYSKEWGTREPEVLYRAGYFYGKLEREVVLGQLTILFTSDPEFLVSELIRLGVNITMDTAKRRETESIILEHLMLLWTERSRKG